MARRVFFSFHYERDIFRVSQVRNRGVIRENYERAGFIDHADWESLGIYIHQLKDPRSGLTDYKRRNPFENIYLTNSNPRRYLSEFYPTYDWVDNDGYNNFVSWVEAAAQRANR